MTNTSKPRVRRFQRCYFVYILASLRGVLHVGLTDDLRKRMTQHKAALFDGFTKKYRIDWLINFETYSPPREAARRERQIKGFRREKKIALFAESDPQWKDLTPEIFQSIGIPPLRQAQGRDSRKKATDAAELQSSPVSHES